MQHWVRYTRRAMLVCVCVRVRGLALAPPKGASNRCVWVDDDTFADYADTVPPSFHRDMICASLPRPFVPQSIRAHHASTATAGSDVWRWRKV